MTVVCAMAVSPAEPQLRWGTWDWQHAGSPPPQSCSCCTMAWLWHCDTPCHATLQGTTPCLGGPCHATPRGTMPQHVGPCHAMPCDVAPCGTTPGGTMPHHVAPHYITWDPATPHHATWHLLKAQGMLLLLGFVTPPAKCPSCRHILIATTCAPSPGRGEFCWPWGPMSSCSRQW